MHLKRAVTLSVLLLIILGVAFMALRVATFPMETASVVLRKPAAITRLTRGPTHALRPTWSPDNHLIAFESNPNGVFQIYVMNADGSGQRALTSGPNENRRPVWTPDGKSILYDSFDGTRQDIWSVNVADGSRKQLTRVDGLADFATLSPDGRQIVFYLYRDMTLNLWTARADGSDAKPLTRDLADARREQPTTSWHQVGWSPDSQWLTFTGGDGKSIWIVRRDGSDAVAIVDDGETNHFPWFLSEWRVAYITEYVPPKYDASWTNAWVHDLKTGQRTLMQDYMSMQGPVDWSTDYSKILFSSPRAGNFDIYLIDLNAPGGLQALHGTAVSTKQVAH